MGSEVLWGISLHPALTESSPFPPGQSLSPPGLSWM